MNLTHKAQLELLSTAARSGLEAMTPKECGPEFGSFAHAIDLSLRFTPSTLVLRVRLTRPTVKHKNRCSTTKR